jgi:hypothetical protein
MRRFAAGVVVGLLLAGAPAWAGWYTNAAALHRMRGEACGAPYIHGYVAGVHDLMAALYPVTSHTIGDLSDRVAAKTLTLDDPRSAAAAWVVLGVLIDLAIVTQEDGLRALPETQRAKFLKEKERY